MAKIIAVCTSENKGTQKTPQAFIDLIVDHGIKGDAHAGNWHRQVSLLSFEKLKPLKPRGLIWKMGHLVKISL